MGLEIHLIGSILTKIIPHRHVINRPGGQRIPAIKQINPINPAPDPLINPLMLKPTTNNPIPLKVIMNREHLAPNLIQILDSYVLLEIEVGEFDAVHFAEQGELAGGGGLVTFVEQKALETLHEAEVPAGEDEWEVGDRGFVGGVAVFGG